MTRHEDLIPTVKFGPDNSIYLLSRLGSPRGKVLRLDPGRTNLGRALVVVPESAIVPRGTDKIVYSIENGRAVETKVRLGQRSNGRVEVLEGVKADAIVVTAGQHKLKNGSLVDTIASSEPVVGGG